jgi:Domain of unknown function (DUF4760)
MILPKRVYIPIILLAVGMVISHWVFPSLRSTIEFAAAIIGALMAIFGALFFYVSLKNSQIQAQRRRSMEIIDQLNQYESIQRREVLKETLKRLQNNNMVEKLKENTENYNTASQLLGIFEDIALMIKWDLADEWILYDSIGYMIPFYYDMLLPLIMQQRNECDDITIYERVEGLATCWKEIRSFRTGRHLVEPTS